MNPTAVNEASRTYRLMVKNEEDKIGLISEIYQTTKKFQKNKSLNQELFARLLIELNEKANNMLISVNIREIAKPQTKLTKPPDLDFLYFTSLTEATKKLNDFLKVRDRINTVYTFYSLKTKWLNLKASLSLNVNDMFLKASNVSPIPQNSGIAMELLESKLDYGQEHGYGLGAPDSEEGINYGEMKKWAT